MAAKSRGFLLVLEGIDGAGKSTQARLLAQALRRRGFRVCLVREPSDSPTGRQLREYLAGRERHLDPARELALFMADRREQVERTVAPALAAGEVVVSDRSYYSSAAYQGALGLETATIIAANESFAPRPDVVFLLTLPVTEALARRRREGASPGQLSETREYLERVSAIYAAFTGPHIIPVAADQPVEALHQRLLALALDALEKAGVHPQGSEAEG